MSLKTLCFFQASPQNSSVPLGNSSVPHGNDEATKLFSCVSEQGAAAAAELDKWHLEMVSFFVLLVCILHRPIE